MEDPKPPPEEKNTWEDVRNTVREGVRELRNIGDELARQGRLRMDIYQAERRLKTAHEELGKAVHERFAASQHVSSDDSVISELRVQITYYEAELKRLHDDLHKASGGMN
jgi:chromosome segregation ATPase